ncbi:MAG: hypothetical protein K2M94_03655 [Paramuribaculum sp.]|nr:hypothetical protein [Paramuribaculum sp.]
MTRFDGGKEQLRRFNPSSEPENITTTAGEISFSSDIDTVTIKLNHWESAMLQITNADNDSAFIHIYRRAVNPYENPPLDIQTVASSGMLTRQQAIFDIDALIDGISNVHPDMFSVCKQTEFFHAVNKLKQSIPDSIGIPELYLNLTRIVSMLGDGHTHLLLPEEIVLTDSEYFMPLFINVTPEKSLKTIWCKGNMIPYNSDIISINGISADSLIINMLPLESGERDHFKLMRVNYDFTGLFKLMYPADKYDIAYHTNKSKNVKTVTLYPEKWDKIKSHFAVNQDNLSTTPYSYTIDTSQNLAILDFKSFRDENQMKFFADSMFRELRDKNIDNLIIDLRENGGGNSMVGDILLRYICPTPFIQMDKILIRITPLTTRLLNARNDTAEFTLIESPESDYIQPLSTDNGFYKGNIYLLTSSKTFSAAASFAWLFSQCGIGKIIGEETGGMNVSFGDKVWYKLPVSGLECGISFKRFWQFQADESSIHGAIPDIYVPANDALSKAISFIKSKQ